MAGQGPTFADLDDRRQKLRGVRLSRAEWARRAGVSESTVTKGIKEGRAPTRPVRQQLELILEAVQKMAEAGL